MCCYYSTYKNTLCPKETSYIIKQVQSLPFKNRLKLILCILARNAFKVSLTKHCLKANCSTLGTTLCIIFVNCQLIKLIVSIPASN